MTPLSPDFLLGFRLAKATPEEIKIALADRPQDLDSLLRMHTIAERIAPILDAHLGGDDTEVSK